MATRRKKNFNFSLTDTYSLHFGSVCSPAKTRLIKYFSFSKKKSLSLISWGLLSCNVMNWIKHVLWLVKMKQVLSYYHCTILSQEAKRASDWGCQNTYCPGRGREQSTGRSLPWKGHGDISIPHWLRLQWGSSLSRWNGKVLSMLNEKRWPLEASSNNARIALLLFCNENYI